jgi:ribosomal-protein-alanine N-acetyltransferase
MEGSFDLQEKERQKDAKISVGPMSQCDLEEVLEIEKKSFPSPWSKALFVRELSNRASKLFVAREEVEGMARLFGYVCFWIVADEAHILNLAVHPSYRRLNTASLLLLHTLAYCREQGVVHIFLEVRRSNRPAQSLYKKFGFVINSIRKGYYNDTREDALVMILDL